MINGKDPTPSVIVIFGASGDLTKRKLMPALFNLFLDKRLPEQFCIIGMDRKSATLRDFINDAREGVDTFSRQGKSSDQDWAQFSKHLMHDTADFSDAGEFTKLAATLEGLDKKWNTKASHIYYLAIPPAGIQLVASQLGKAKLSRDRDRSRLVIEKPFGHDLVSAEALNISLTEWFVEKQIYRIDHYLGKETVQNLLAFRFANALFEPLWDRKYIDHVQITVAEQVGVEMRGNYYEQAGALRDMIQNHMLQLLCLIAMEPPISFDADEIRNKKVDVLKAIRPIPHDDVYKYAVRGQYGAGWLEGEKVPAYRSESNVAPTSSTETFAALKLLVDNWRWQDVPFYLRTGKRLAARISEVTIVFKPVPHQAFPASASDHWQPNILNINIQPTEGIVLEFQAKQPGTSMRLKTVGMEFNYEEAFKAEPPEAYETLLRDVMVGDSTLFMRSDQEHCAWSIVQPIIDVWTTVPSNDFPNYAPGTWGPETAEMLIAKDGRSWQTNLYQTEA